MSYEVVQEKIKVLAVFKDGTVFPHVFEWNGRRYKVDKVNLSYQEREGSSINYYFAVGSNLSAIESNQESSKFCDRKTLRKSDTDSGGIISSVVAKIKYNDKSMLWSLEEVWTE
jgi:hypothetical protein